MLKELCEYCNGELDWRIEGEYLIAKCKSCGREWRYY